MYVAVSMDERLDNLAVELDAPDELLLRVDDPDLAPKILLGLDYACENRDAIASSLAERVAVMQDEARKQAAWFASYIHTK